MSAYRELVFTATASPMPGDVSRDPVEVLHDVRRVHDEHEVLVGQPVRQHIVHERALGGRESRVVRLADGEPGGVVARDVLDRLEGVAARDLDLAHVADIEQPARVLTA